MNFLKTSWTTFLGTVKGFDSPHQLALGAAFGMCAGIIPKDSLFPYAIGMIALLTTANIVCIAMSALVVSWISPLLDPISHKIGTYVLTLDSLEPTWTALFQLPVMPWTRFENTVVTGSLCLGILLAVPVYSLSYYCFAKFGSAIFSYLSNTRVARWLVNNQSTHLQES